MKKNHYNKNNNNNTLADPRGRVRIIYIFLYYNYSICSIIQIILRILTKTMLSKKPAGIKRANN